MIDKNELFEVEREYRVDPKRKTDPITGLAYSRRTYDQLLKDIAIE